MEKLNGLDLFSGIGGITVALQDWVRPIAYCERDLYCISVLLERMRSEDIPLAPICTDVRELRGSYLGDVDVIYGGFPCQDISVAGRGEGLAGERSSLYWEIHRLANETKAPFLFLENVPAIRTRGLNEVVRSLTEIGYDCRWTSVSAAAVGAHHKRERWFLLAAHAECLKLWGESGRGIWQSGEGAPFAGDDGAERNSARSSERHTEPSVDRDGNGLPFRVDRIKSLGNSVVPAQAREAFMRLIGLRELNDPLLAICNLHSVWKCGDNEE